MHGRSKDYINVADGESYHSKQKLASLNAHLLATRNKAKQNNLTSMTAGTLSDVSTTIAAPSQAAARR